MPPPEELPEDTVAPEVLEPEEGLVLELEDEPRLNPVPELLERPDPLELPNPPEPNVEPPREDPPGEDPPIVEPPIPETEEEAAPRPPPPPGSPARGWPKNPLTVVLASPRWIRRQSAFPVIGSVYFCRRKRMSEVFTS